MEDMYSAVVGSTAAVLSNKLLQMANGAVYDENGEVIRSSALTAACKMVKPVVKDLMDTGFNGYIVSVTNPLDAVTRLIWKLSGLPSPHHLHRAA